MSHRDTTDDPTAHRDPFPHGPGGPLPRVSPVKIPTTYEVDEGFPDVRRVRICESNYFWFRLFVH